MLRPIFLLISLFCLALLIPGLDLWAQNNPLDSSTLSATQPPSVLTELAVLAALALLPFAVMLLTSYTKVVIVLSLLRNALGVQQAPPNQVLNGIALLITIYVMFPTVSAMYHAGGDLMKSSPENLFSHKTAEYFFNIADKTKEPLKEFLQRNCSGKHITSFYQLAYRSFPPEYRQSLKPTDFIIIIPAFITSQLKAAFEIGDRKSVV